MENEPWNYRAHRDPEEADKTARRIVKIAELDAEDCNWAPNDFEECVELVKKNIILAEMGKRDEVLDDLIYQRGVKKLISKYGLEGKVKVELKEVK